MSPKTTLALNNHIELLISWTEKKHGMPIKLKNNKMYIKNIENDYLKISAL